MLKPHCVLEPVGSISLLRPPSVMYSTTLGLVGPAGTTGIKLLPVRYSGVGLKEYLLALAGFAVAGMYLATATTELRCHAQGLPQGT